MRPSDLDLQALRKPVIEALDVFRCDPSYRRELRFGEFQDFTLTPDKPNSARTVIPATYSGHPIGDMYTIVFFPGDGTGDTSTYKPGELVIPERLRYKEKPERVYPRSKKGVICEGYFPLFLTNGTRSALIAPEMEELVLNGNNVEHGWTLGEAKAVYFTTGTKDGRRFGDPHAIHYPVGRNFNAAAVVGFLALKDENLPIEKITESWYYPFFRNYGTCGISI